MAEGNGWDEHKRLVEYRLDELMAGQEKLISSIDAMVKENIEHRAKCQDKFAKVDKEISNIKTAARAWSVGISTGVSGALFWVKSMIWGG